MYPAFWLWAIAQALLLPNWLPGRGLGRFWILFFGRVAREERMMLEALTAIARIWRGPAAFSPNLLKSLQYLIEGASSTSSSCVLFLQHSSKKDWAIVCLGRCLLARSNHQVT